MLEILALINGISLRTYSIFLFSGSFSSDWVTGNAEKSGMLVSSKMTDEESIEDFSSKKRDSPALAAAPTVFSTSRASKAFEIAFNAFLVATLVASVAITRASRSESRISKTFERFPAANASAALLTASCTHDLKTEVTTSWTSSVVSFPVKTGSDVGCS